jgi:peptidoglycan/xylan/chitin deacetylase (PgdA/CDA1 family)
VNALRLALTLDDAPSIAESGVPADPAIMDAIRETLKSNRVQHCVAFVIGRIAAGHEATLERWLADGYELGNHTFEHPRAGRVDVTTFIESVRRCHELLERIGAFQSGNPRWFRFPYLSRGRDRKARDEIHAACAGLGYRIAHASADFHDDRFEQQFERARRTGNRAAAETVGDRYEQVALGSLRHAANRMLRTQGRVAPLVPYGHFGPITRDRLDGILATLRTARAELCTLDEAMADPVYRSFDEDRSRDGLVTSTLPRSPLARAVARVVRLSERTGVAGQRRYGPRWPYLR